MTKRKAEWVRLKRERAEADALVERVIEACADAALESVYVSGPRFGASAMAAEVRSAVRAAGRRAAKGVE